MALAGHGGFVATAVLALATQSGVAILLMAPFGASCVLVFALPQGPLSQPLNVIGGHAVATAVGLVSRACLPPTWWALALAVGLAIAAMVALRITHPPAGADPLVVFAAHSGPGFLLFPVMSGASMLIVVAIIFHRLTATPYPTRTG